MAVPSRPYPRPGEGRQAIGTVRASLRSRCSRQAMALPFSQHGYRVRRAMRDFRRIDAWLRETLSEGSSATGAKPRAARVAGCLPARAFPTTECRRLQARGPDASRCGEPVSAAAPEAILGGEGKRIGLAPPARRFQGTRSVIGVPLPGLPAPKQSGPCHRAQTTARFAAALRLRFCSTEETGCAALAPRTGWSNAPAAGCSCWIPGQAPSNSRHSGPNRTGGRLFRFLKGP